MAVNGSAGGALKRAGDHDWFRVERVANHLYRIDLFGFASGNSSLYDPCLCLRGDAGELVTCDDDGGEGCEGCDGSHRVRLTDASGLVLIGSGVSAALVFATVTPGTVLVAGDFVGV